MDQYLRGSIIRTTLLAIILLFVVSSAYGATMVAKDNAGNTVWLYEEPCAEQMLLDMIKPEMRGLFKRSLMNYQGKDYKACWAVGPDGMVYIVDEANDITQLPPQAFRNATEV